MKKSEISRLMSHLGSRTSEAKTAAARANCNLKPKEGKMPRGRPKKKTENNSNLALDKPNG
jgi:hypothetical protein